MAQLAVAGFLQLPLRIMACIHFLTKGLIHCYSTGYRYIQGFNNAHLRNDKITITQGNCFFANTAMLIAKYQGHFLSKLQLVHAYGIATKMSGIYFIIVPTQCCKAFCCICKLVNAEPFGSTRRAFSTPFFMTWYLSI